MRGTASSHGTFIDRCSPEDLASVADDPPRTAHPLMATLDRPSIRAGLLEEREEWKGVQRFVIEHVIDPIFREWLSYALLSDALDLPAAKLEKFETVEWKPRRWQWVDPLKDTQANVVAVANGFKSRRAIISETGGDIEDTFEEIAADNQLAESKGVELEVIGRGIKRLPQLPSTPKKQPPRGE